MFESNGEGVPQFQDEQQDDDRSQPGQGDVPGLAPAAGSINSRSFIEGAVNLGECGQKKNCCPARVLPNDLARDHGGEQFRVSDDGKRVMSVCPQIIVDHAGATQNLLEYGHDNDPGEKVREVQDRLDDLPDPVGQQTVQKEGDQDWRRENENRLQGSDDQSVFKGIEKCRIAVEYDGKVVKTGSSELRV